MTSSQIALHHGYHNEDYEHHYDYHNDDYYHHHCNIRLDQVQHRGVIYGGRHLLPLRPPHRLPRRLSSRQVPLLSFSPLFSFCAGLVWQKFYHSHLPSES